MNLIEVSYKLEVIAQQLTLKIPQLQEADAKFQLRFADLVLHSAGGTIAAREAEANLTCEQEGLLSPLYDLKGDVRALYHQKDCYIAIAANLRAMLRGEYEQEQHQSQA